MLRLKFNKKGFTLIELVIVLSIISIIAMIAAPKYLKYKQYAEKETALNLGRQIQLCVVNYEFKEELKEGASKETKDKLRSEIANSLNIGINNIKSIGISNENSCNKVTTNYLNNKKEYRCIVKINDKKDKICDVEEVGPEEQRTTNSIKAVRRVYEKE
ncbi:prepilin-type N-terminal cleavage/methylation domain-containing protein [Haloimpatiens sp. FM7330]|uniref:prepilin-type N-terminal cleavage/methylation domain-containing protein n=1 Tax=Haloimpatiens sp. FM7330 TaxID=3298610 RepID=UPI003624E20D